MAAAGVDAAMMADTSADAAADVAAAEVATCFSVSRGGAAACGRKKRQRDRTAECAKAKAKRVAEKMERAQEQDKIATLQKEIEVLQQRLAHEERVRDRLENLLFGIGSDRENFVRREH